MSTFTQILPVAGTLLGTLVGGALTHLLAWRNSQQADKRILRECLYPLLEVYALLMQAGQLRTFCRELLTELKEHFPDTFPASTVELEDEKLLEFMSQLLLPRLTQEMQQVKESFDASLLKLASVDPISAHRLQGKESVISTVRDYTASLTEKIVEVAKPEEQISAAAALPVLYTFLEQAMVVHAVKRVEEIVVRIAKRIDKQTLQEAQQVMVRNQAKTTERKQEIQNFIQQFTPLLRQVSKASQGQGK
ncbi:hypothetical protein DNI29_23095 [Hymenobacter sediminis]|uniref:hypothetical protein n=1 Tax=Hymenobacter sediminis TaxID=2218621 RepID=UPI000DA648A5|nr:hypothetical protein [Hymenobacter sediminis]RPD43749.1 hypothetical protein DNI29_23095 [Hymenobacter sediminis]